ncbi:malate synthase 2-like isoform X2 [Helicoverpa zea]|uniref:malate synthase 2-like isoform X2 n=1 Tax=Helicoverpa zea TaxID=7113 RepID=UPI001F5A8E35|nr:malate synthase 2-like isoform X2 [Helicoverpa zea]
MSKVLLLQSPPPKFEDIQKSIFNEGAVDFLYRLHKTFEKSIEKLYKDRLRRTVTTQTLSTLDFKRSPERSDKSWTIAPLPPRLLNRHLDLGDVSASNTAHFVSSLNEDVQGIQVDFDDGHCPTWKNQLQAYQNIKLAVKGKLLGAPVTITTSPILMLRPRAWNMIEHNILLFSRLERNRFPGDREEFLLPDRNKYVNMDRHFLSSYLKLVVSTCHARGAPATGGMAAAMLKPGSDINDKESKAIITKILAAKQKEIENGVDGFMVYDARVVPHINELWKKSGATPNQICKKFDVNITPQDLLSIPRDGVTLQGIRHNVAITILFIYYWLAGIGHFFYSGNVEDSATAEISRFQIWQWIRFAPPLEDDPEVHVTARLIEKKAASFATHAHKNLCRSNAERKRLTAARYMSMELFLCRNPPEFITTYLNDNHKFRTLHNKALQSNL